MKNKIFKTILKKMFLLIFFCTNLYAQNNFFNEGKKLFDKNEYDEAKLSFEKDIVYNPKNENSYLFLAKIFNKQKDSLQEERNLNTVVLLNPKNEEAIYHLALLSIKRSNYKKTSSLITKFKSICIKLCDLEKELSLKLKNSLK